MNKNNLVFKDDYVTAFIKSNNKNNIHIIIFPNKKIKSLNEIEESDNIYLSKILLTAKLLAKKFNIHETGYNLINNCNNNINHELNFLHFHLIENYQFNNDTSFLKNNYIDDLDDFFSFNEF